MGKWDKPFDLRLFNQFGNFWKMMRALGQRVILEVDIMSNKIFENLIVKESS